MGKKLVGRDSAPLATKKKKNKKSPRGREEDSRPREKPRRPKDAGDLAREQISRSFLTAARKGKWTDIGEGKSLSLRGRVLEDESLKNRVEGMSAGKLTERGSFRGKCLSLLRQ